MLPPIRRDVAIPRRLAVLNPQGAPSAITGQSDRRPLGHRRIDGESGLPAKGVVLRSNPRIRSCSGWRPIRVCPGPHGPRAEGAALAMP